MMCARTRKRANLFQLAPQNPQNSIFRRPKYLLGMPHNRARSAPERAATAKRPKYLHTANRRTLGGWGARCLFIQSLKYLCAVGVVGAVDFARVYLKRPAARSHAAPLGRE